MTDECPRHPGKEIRHSCIQCAREDPRPKDPLKVRIVHETVATTIIAIAALAICGTEPATAVTSVMAAANCALAWLYSELHHHRAASWRQLNEAAFWRTGALAAAAISLIF